ncbi:MAG: hypothetical protein GY801_38040 [bacterium]|nr:hypothetical protein [bacterium]
MKNFFRTLMLLSMTCIVSIVVGMISPGEWLSKQQRLVTKLYNENLRFRGSPIAENFCTTPHNLHIIYVENTEGKLESYLVNSPKNEMLPILEVEGTTQVGDVAHRFKGLGEEGRGKLKNILESVKGGGSSALDKALRLLGN